MCALLAQIKPVYYAYQCNILQHSVTDYNRLHMYDFGLHSFFLFPLFPSLLQSVNLLSMTRIVAATQLPILHNWVPLPNYQKFLSVSRRSWLDKCTASQRKNVYNGDEWNRSGSLSSKESAGAECLLHARIGCEIRALIITNRASERYSEHSKREYHEPRKDSCDWQDWGLTYKREEGIQDKNSHDTQINLNK